MRHLWILFPLWVFLLSYAFYRFSTQGEGEFVPSQLTVEQQMPVEIRSALPVATGTHVRHEPAFSPLQPLDAESYERRIALGLAELDVFGGDGDSAGISFLWPADDEGEPSDERRLEIASKREISRWVPFEDEWIGFYVPDMGLDVARVSPGEVRDVVAPMFLPSYADAVRAYQLKKDGMPVAAVFVHEEDRFDDAARFPRPEEFHRYIFQNGSLARYSFTGAGEVRRVQILGLKTRVTILDWPHCALHQDVYRKMALSLHLKRPTVDSTIARRKIIELYGLEGALGLLPRGTPEAELDTLLGNPVGKVEDLRIYAETSLRGECHYRISLLDGMFGGFPENWKEWRRDPPARMSLAWMLEKSETEAGPAGSVGYSLGPLSDADANAIFARFLEMAPACDGSEWEVLCRILTNLAEKGLRDPRVVPVIRSRFLDPNLTQRHALQVLHVHDADGSRELLADRLRLLLVRSGPWPVDFSSSETLRDAKEGMLGELQVLFAYVGRNYKTMPLLVRRATEHPNAGVRAIGYGFIDWLDEESRMGIVRAGLTDPSPSVRRRCAEFCAEKRGDLPESLRKWIGGVRQAESDVQTRSFLSIVNGSSN